MTQFVDMKGLIVPHMPPPAPLRPPTSCSPDHPSRSPTHGSPVKKPRTPYTNATPSTSPPSTPGREQNPPTTLAITKNTVGGKQSRGSSPAVSPTSPRGGKPHGKMGVHKSPQPKSPISKSSAAKSPAKSPKKAAS